MAKVEGVFRTDLPLAGRRSGKVRDVYRTDLADGTAGLVIVATDRVSAFDVVMANGVTGRGIVLTQISKFWFDYFADRVPHHLVSTDPSDIPGLSADQRLVLDRRVMIGRRARVIPIECVVRGYLAGSGWKEYQQSQTVCGVALGSGLGQCERLPEPIFTPATKAEEGHDENISFERACEIAGRSLMDKLRDLSVMIYSEARDYAAERGIILADTKFEFGIPEDGQEPILIDEVLTPDSSRFWPADEYEPGRDQNSFDKQIVRNYLQGLCDRGQWDKSPPGPTLPDEVVQRTIGRYLQAYRMLTGQALEI
jgi:phosphoribosylaminoimidazole-succinocarboxamide synthase